MGPPSRLLLLLLAIGAATPACGSSTEPDTGLDLHETAEDAAADAAATADVASPDAAASDVPSPLDAAIDVVPDTADTEPAVVPTPTLSDYPPCERNADCPIGFGRCLTELTFHVQDAASIATVSIASLDPSRSLPGICTLPCTFGAAACDGLQLQLGDGPSRPFACQVVAAGQSPYPSEPVELPLDLDPEALANGHAYSAICRPPFELSSDRHDDFCKPCTSAASCGGGALCWATGAGARGSVERPGECVETCEADADCVFGFACEALVESAEGAPSELGNYCVPRLGTCGPCLDVDGDGRGLGLCADGGMASTPVDCDDANPDAYYDPADPGHPFPDFCGDFDLNCNGLSDEDEQRVSAAHCGGCDSPCEGEVASDEAGASKVCLIDGTCGLLCDLAETRADCDGVLDNGCEVSVTDPSQFVHLDADGDGDGRSTPSESPPSPLFTCTPDDIPEGYARSSTDCDDGDEFTSGLFGVDDQCDDVDQDCDGETDEGYQPVACDSTALGECRPGTTRCDDGATSCVPTLTPSPETCADVGADNDCDGSTDDVFNGSTDVVVGAGCLAADAVGQCRDGTWACVSGAITCVAGAPAADAFGNNVDENCDGVDGVAAETVFVSTNGHDTTGTGSASAPYATLQRGIDRAVALGRPMVRVASGTYNQTSRLRLRPGVTVQGSHNQAGGWQLGGARTVAVIKSDATSSGDGARAFTGSLGMTCQQAATTSANSGGLRGVDVTVTRFGAGSNGESVVGAWFKGCGWLSFSDAKLTVADGAPGAAAPTPGAAGTSGGAGADGERGERGDDMPGAAAVAGGTSGCERPGGKSGKGGNARTTYDSDSNGATGSPGQLFPQGGGPGGPGGRWNLVRSGASGLGGAAASTGGNGGHPGRRNPNDVDDFLSSSYRKGGTGLAGKDGHGGGGGGGGSAGAIGGIGADFKTSGSSGGGGGGGGCGGSAGVGGQGGGHSIGVVIEGTSVSLTGLRLTLGAGGAGGNGAMGGAGGSGGPGGAGGEPLDDAGTGGVGGAGGAGSGGGGGGGGAGGRSAAVVRLGSGLSWGSPQIVLGTGGMGGAGGLGGQGAVSGQPGEDGEDGTPAVSSLQLNP